MNLEKYEELTGTSVSDSNRARVTAKIRRTRGILEEMLGFTLDPSLYNQNEYTETGKTKTDFPHPDDDLTLDGADSVVGAYRLFDYNDKDTYFLIDPASAIHAVKMVRAGVTYKTLETDEYAPRKKRGIIQSIHQHFHDGLLPDSLPYYNYYFGHGQGLQLAVDATWLWSSIDNMPEEILDIWTEMVEYYSDKKRDIQSETLGPHSYRKFDKGAPENREHNIIVLKRYAGPHGSLNQDLTL